MPKKSGATRKAAATKSKPKAKAASKPAKPAKPAKVVAKKPEKPAPKAAEKATKPAKTAAAPKGTTTKAAPAPATDASGKPVRKGITIVSPKPVKKVKQPVSMANVIPSGMGRLLDPKAPRKPLIPSGPKATSGRALGQHGGHEQAAAPLELKTWMTKAQLDHFRQLLNKKRLELVGDVNAMEKEALRAESGSLSNMPSHLAEQGSDASEQSLSLDLAAADRKLIREIDDALVRISKGTYGVCEATGKPIKLERLEELPWARHSIEAARELERQGMRF